MLSIKFKMAILATTLYQKWKLSYFVIFCSSFRLLWILTFILALEINKLCQCKKSFVEYFQLWIRKLAVLSIDLYIYDLAARLVATILNPALLFDWHYSYLYNGKPWCWTGHLSLKWYLCCYFVSHFFLKRICYLVLTMYIVQILNKIIIYYSHISKGYQRWTPR